MSGSEAEARPAPDWRLVPIAAAVWAAAWWATSERPLAATVPCLLICALSVLAAARGFGRWAAASVVAATLAAAAIAGLAHHEVADGPIAEAARDGALVHVTGVVTADVRRYAAQGIRPALSTTRVEARQVTVSGNQLTTRVSLDVLASGDRADRLSGLEVGDTVDLAGLLRAREPGDEVAGTVRLTAAPTVVSRPGWFDRGVNRVRASMRESMRWAGGTEAALVPSLVLGDTGGISRSVNDAFRVTSLSHLMAVSGANLALVVAFVGAVAGRLGVRDRALDAVRLLSVGGFVVVCRAEPSVIRAAAMGLVTLAVIGRPGRPGRGVRHLSLAVCGVLLLLPWLSRSWGFALSVAATGGIVWWSRRWCEVLAGRWPLWVAELIAVPLAAQLATQPLITAIAGGVSAVGLAANVLAAPFVAPVTVVGLVAALANLLPGPLGPAAGWAAAQLAAPIVLIAEKTSRLPGAQWPWPTTSIALALLTVASLAVAHLVPRLLASRRLLLATGLSLVLLVWWTPRTPGWPGPWQAVFCDVGQADTTVLRAARDQAVVVDVGNADGKSTACLAGLGVRRVPLVVLTHFHADHTGGLDDLLSAVPVGQIWLNPFASPAADAARVREAAARHGVPVVVATAGQRATVGDVELRVVSGGSASPESGGEGESSAENDSSLIVEASIAALSVLVPGDAEPAGQRAAVATRQLGSVDVLKIPHHGSARQDEAFWRTTTARLAVASAGKDNDYGHPARAALALAARCGMVVARTDQQGSIAVWKDGEVHVRTTRSG